MLGKAIITTVMPSYPLARKHVVKHPTTEVWIEICHKCGHKWVIRKDYRPQRCEQRDCRARLGNGNNEEVRMPLPSPQPVWECHRCGSQWRIYTLTKPVFCQVNSCLNWDLEWIRKERK